MEVEYTINKTESGVALLKSLVKRRCDGHVKIYWDNCAPVEESTALFAKVEKVARRNGIELKINNGVGSSLKEHQNTTVYKIKKINLLGKIFTNPFANKE